MLPYLIIPAFSALVLLIPIGADLSYDSDGLSVYLRLWRKLIKLFPKKKQDNLFSGKNNKKHGLSFHDWPDIITTVRIALKHIEVDKFMLHYTASGADPYDAVSRYGKVYAIVNAVYPLIDAKENDVVIKTDFEKESSIIIFEIKINTRIYKLFEISFSEGAAVLKIFLNRFIKHRKANHGKQTKRYDADYNV